VFRRYYPIILAIGIFCAALAACLILSLRENQGHLVYALDDPYIHMAIAKNLVQHGIWGVTRHGFTSSASSLFWPLLLSVVYFLFGVNEWAPFALNVIFALTVCFSAYFLFRKYKIRNSVILIGLTAIIFFTSLLSLIFCGQEHVLHLLVTIVFVYFSAKILSAEKSHDREYLLLLILSSILTMSRYEGLFLLFIVGCLFIARKKYLHALLLAGFGLLPLTVYGLLSVSKGWYFLPNSVLLKGSMLDDSSFLGIVKFFSFSFDNLLATPHLLVIVVTLLAIYCLRAKNPKGFWENKQLMAVIFIMAVFLHMQFAKTGWFYRYEAYLVGLGIFIITIFLEEFLPDSRESNIYHSFIPVSGFVVFLFCLLIFPLAKRGFTAVAEIPRAAKNIYEQQYQMGLFVKRFYQGKTVALNDIGVVDYLADINTVDLYGLGAMETGRLKVQKKFIAENIEDIVKKKRVSIAIIYDSWFIMQHKMLEGWVKVGQWKISSNIICGSDTVSFYAVDPFERDNLIKNLRFFSASLPQDVKQSGVYTIGE